jgi:prepilin signal peptidase PulO-like enzyme (type II secretory pathway)
MYTMVILILVILGLCLGSFVNALVWRLREQEQASKKSKVHKVNSGSKSRTLNLKNFKLSTSKNDLSILKGRSMCPDCHHTLAAKDLVPVLSWVTLRGKCRYCHESISWQYPLVELVTAALFVASYVYWPPEFNTMGKVNFAAWCVVLVGFVALFVYDLKWMMLPNRITYPLIGLTTVLAIVNFTVFDGGMTGLMNTVISMVIAAGLFYALYRMSDGKWIGGGDPKLGLVIGLTITAPLQAFLVLFLASIIGTFVAMPGLLSKKLKSTSHIPFGPFLIIAAIIVRLFGAGITAWYRRRFLLY